ncbi:hypothetical protein D9V96_000740 [Zobellia laminariae]|uniref:hypothetical protein n=1 Tax=Zobellia laminariae TaxID=248906 RepID=UPI0012D8A45F|nr:hypothetical protein [Zobellia laminariae]
MKNNIFNKPLMAENPESVFVENEKLKTMENAPRARRINRQILKMDDEKDTQKESAFKISPPKGKANNFMAAFEPEISFKDKKQTDLPDQEELKTVQKATASDYHIRMRFKVKDGEISVADIIKVKGDFVNENQLNAHGGFVYEVSKRNKQLQTGVIPDAGVRRGFPHPNPKNTEEQGHSVAVADEFDFNIKLPVKQVTAASLKSFKVDLYRAKAGIDNEFVASNISLKEQFGEKLRKVASFKTIKLSEMPSATRKRFESALKR